MRLFRMNTTFTSTDKPLLNVSPIDDLLIIIPAKAGCCAW
jgi:hypothetical protein